MRKKAKKFYFSVEGKTEEYYFRWLFKEINNHKDSTQKVIIDIVVTDSPISYAKRISVPYPVMAFHVTDTESESEEHQNNFKRELEEMHTVSTTTRNKVSIYKLAYSNLSFELWMILHKIDSFAYVNQCNNYLPFINKAFDTEFKSLGDYKKEKGFTGILNNLTLTDVIQAIQKAKTLLKLKKNNGHKKQKYKNQYYYIKNPALSVHEIVEEILIEVGIIKIKKRKGGGKK